MDEMDLMQKSLAEDHDDDHSDEEFDSDDLGDEDIRGKEEMAQVYN